MMPSSAHQGLYEWELDFYSRPVQGPDGKKLWELLVTDAQGTFQHVEAVPSNCVNSRELRARVQRLIDDTPLKPKKIRFFRTQMKNMISIALNELPDVLALPSRATYQLYDWIDERQREVPPTCPATDRGRRLAHPTTPRPPRPPGPPPPRPAPSATPCGPQVYPAMAGYRPPRPEAPMIKLPVKLPEQLRGEKYAFVTLPYAEFVPGGRCRSARACARPRQRQRTGASATARPRHRATAPPRTARLRARREPFPDLPAAQHHAGEHRFRVALPAAARRTRCRVHRARRRHLLAAICRDCCVAHRRGSRVREGDA